MATSKDEFIQDAVDEISNYPTISQRWQIGDPFVTQHLAAFSAMLADLSNQVELTAGEIYLKARDATILADAAAKGVLPFATPAVASIQLLNEGKIYVRVTAGRVLVDQAGRYWQVLVGANVAPGGTGTITAKQVTLRTLTHQVTQNIPFYSVELAEPEVGHIAEVVVTGFTYTPEFCNVSPGDAVYHIKSDENQVMSLVFGVAGVAGTQLPAGYSLNLSIYDTEGEISLAQGTTFTFEYTNTGDDDVTLKLLDVTQAGAAPMDLVTMAEVCGYPGIYNESGVYLSNFDYLVRKKVTPLTFLSVWNETREEEVRGANLDNINVTFVASKRDGTADATLQAKITKVLLEADDSYRVRHVPVVEVVMPLELTLEIPSTYDAAAVKQSARSLLLKQYGRDSAWAKRGSARILEKDVHKLLHDNVPALTQRLAEITVDVIGTSATVLPEHFRYITEESLVIKEKEADEWT